MGLKDLKSNLDLPKLNQLGNPVEQTVPTPDYNTQQGASDSPFDPKGDHMVTLLDQTSNTSTGNTYLPAPSESPYQDLDGNPGPQFQLPTQQASQKHIDSLQEVPGGSQNSPFQDLDGVQGPQFDNGMSSTLHVDSLSQVPGGTENSPHQDLDGLPDPNFNTQQGTVDSPFGQKGVDHMVDLLKNKGAFSTNTGVTYPSSQQTVPETDINGNKGPSFMNTNQIQTQITSLEDIYQSTINPGASYGAGQPGATYPNFKPAELDINGQKGPEFDFNQNGTQSPTLHEDLLANTYQSTINPGSSYGAGQPGGTWPNVQPSPISPGGLQDLDGVTPPGYVYPS